jgi:hypothetical protein
MSLQFCCLAVAALTFSVAAILDSVPIGIGIGTLGALAFVAMEYLRMQHARMIDVRRDMMRCLARVRKKIS